jgi:putative NADH-flavin reductase
MRITVFGASGGIGSEVVRQSLAAGDEVIAVVRDPSRLAVEPSARLTVLQAQATDPEAILPAVEATDAVVSALGPRPGNQAGICSAGVHAELDAMAKTGVDRLVVVSAAGAFIDGADGVVMRGVVKPLLGRFLRASFDDVRAMEDEVKGSGLAWTIIRPPQLTNGAWTGRYRTAVDIGVKGGRRIARSDVADAIRRVLPDPATARHWVGVAY